MWSRETDKLNARRSELWIHSLEPSWEQNFDQKKKIHIISLACVFRNPTCARYPEKEKVARVDPVIARNLEQCYKPNCEAKATQM